MGAQGFLSKIHRLEKGSLTVEFPKAPWNPVVRPCMNLGWYLDTNLQVQEDEAQVEA
jgi:hypothetical protein